MSSGLRATRWILPLALLAAACVSPRGPEADAKANVELLREMRQDQEARQSAVEPIADDPAPTFEGRLLEGDTLRDSGEAGRALWIYLQAARLKPEDPTPVLRIASLHLSADPERSAEIFRALLKRYPKSADAYTGLGLALLAQGNRAGAEEMLRFAVEKDPRQAAALNALGVILDQAGRYAEARAFLNDASGVQPRNYVPLNNLGRSYLAGGELAAAQSVLERAVQLEARDPAVWNNLGLALGRLGRDQAALEAFRRAGSEQAALNNLGYAAFLSHDYDRALHWYERALLEDGTLASEVRANLLALEAARSKGGAKPEAAPTP